MAQKAAEAAKQRMDSDTEQMLVGGGGCSLVLFCRPALRPALT